MLNYYTQHHMVERLQGLYDSRDSMDRESLRLALIKWDNDQGRAMELSERTLRCPPKKCDQHFDDTGFYVFAKSSATKITPRPSGDGNKRCKYATQRSAFLTSTKAYRSITSVHV
jgi:hypothetical protein